VPAMTAVLLSRLGMMKDHHVSARQPEAIRRSSRARPARQSPPPWHVRGQGPSDMPPQPFAKCRARSVSRSMRAWRNQRLNIEYGALAKRNSIPQVIRAYTSEHRPIGNTKGAIFDLSGTGHRSIRYVLSIHRERRHDPSGTAPSLRIAMAARVGTVERSLNLFKLHKPV
jgi:hypothetical protein